MLAKMMLQVKRTSLNRRSQVGEVHYFNGLLTNYEIILKRFSNKNV
jgi:hypothetical protein